MNTNPEIALATLRDAHRIAAMSRDYIEQGLGWRWRVARVQSAIRDASTNVIVAREQGRPIGFAIMEYQRDEAHLLLLAVEPSRRRVGIASNLIAWLESTAVTAGIGIIHLEVRRHNLAARTLYRKLGYNEVRVMRGWYRGVEDGVWLAKDLWLHAGAHYAGR